jgi:hypothetical protein
MAADPDRSIPIRDPAVRRWPRQHDIDGRIVYEIVWVDPVTNNFVYRYEWEGTDELDEARRIKVIYAGGEDDIDDYDARGRRIRTERRDNSGKLLRVTICAYYADDSYTETVTDYTTTPATVTQSTFPR